MNCKCYLLTAPVKESSGEIIILNVVRSEIKFKFLIHATPGL